MSANKSKYMSEVQNLKVHDIESSIIRMGHAGLQLVIEDGKLFIVDKKEYKRLKSELSIAEIGKELNIRV